MKKAHLLAFLATITLVVGNTPIQAMNDALWSGFTYSVAVTYLPIHEDGIEPPRPNGVVMPDFPLQEMRAAASGFAVISFLVAGDGSVREIKVEQVQGTDYGDAASKAVARWSFSPGRSRKDGKIVESRMRCRIDFRVKDATDESTSEASNR